MNIKSDTINRIERITRMEQTLNDAKTALDALSKALDGYAKIYPTLQDLIAYYESPVWRADYEADERGELPSNLKRGVLSEDAVYNLLTDLDSIYHIMRELSRDDV